MQGAQEKAPSGVAGSKGGARRARKSHRELLGGRGVQGAQERTLSGTTRWKRGARHAGESPIGSCWVKEGCKARRRKPLKAVKSFGGVGWKKGGRGVQTKEWQDLSCTVIWWNWVEEGWKKSANGRMPGLELHNCLAKLGGRGMQKGCIWKNGRTYLNCTIV